MFICCKWSELRELKKWFHSSNHRNHSRKNKQFGSLKVRTGWCEGDLKKTSFHRSEELIQCLNFCIPSDLQIQHSHDQNPKKIICRTRNKNLNSHRLSKEQNNQTTVSKNSKLGTGVSELSLRQSDSSQNHSNQNHSEKRELGRAQRALIGRTPLVKDRKDSPFREWHWKITSVCTDRTALCALNRPHRLNQKTWNYTTTGLGRGFCCCCCCF